MGKKTLCKRFLTDSHALRQNDDLLKTYVTVYNKVHLL